MSDPATSAPDPRRWAVLAVVLSATLIDSIDASMLTVILPSVQSDLDAGAAASQWALVGYSLSFGVLLITGGRAGDVFGLRRVFLAGIVLFALASAGCGFAPNGEWLVAGRFAQGAGAALMVPQAVAVIVVVFPQKQWPGVFAIFGGVLSIGSVTGPLVGGLLTQADIAGLGWRSVFLVNLPICLVATVGALVLLPSRRSREATRLDGRGVLLSTAAALVLLFPLVQGRELGWPWWTWVLMLSSAPVFVVFWRSQQRSHAVDRSALVPPLLFEHRSFGLGLVLTFLIYLAVGSLFLIFTFVVQTGLQWSPLHTAVVTAAWPLGIACTFQFGWRFSSGRERHFVALGAFVMGMGALWLVAVIGVAGESLTSWQVVVALFVLGAGMGLANPVLTALVLREIPQEHTGAGSGVVNAVIQLGGAAGVAILGTMFFELARERQHSLVSAAMYALLGNCVALLAAAVLATRLNRKPAATAEEDTTRDWDVELADHASSSGSSDRGR